MSVSKVLAFIENPIKQYLKFHRINALAAAVQSTRGIAVGDNVCLQSIKYLEIELGIRKADEVNNKEETSEVPGKKFRDEANQILMDEDDE